MDMLLSASSISRRELRKLLVSLAFAAIYFGLAGILGMLFMQWLMRQSYAPDSVAKHGISTRPSSRLGGVAVFTITATLMILSEYLSPGDDLFLSASI